jgi:D-glycero-D-manno-heptose 1,7-bisphosphate phosphatase
VTARRGAVFVDRDNTLVHDPGYLADPARTELLPNAAEGLAAITRAGWPLVVVSNQSGIARGRHTAGEFHAVMARIRELVAPAGVAIIADYFCPHHPDFSGPCACRKPGLALYEQAAREHALDLGASWFVGDRWHDVAPALAVGGRGVLLTRDASAEDVQQAVRHGVPRAHDLVEAALLIGASEG